jgi:hypothetical protein
MIKLILSYLLHHANRETKAEDFYKIKDRILTKYGKVIGHDVQHIPGKICFACNGTGEPLWINDQDDEHCSRCYGDGWYKQPKWILLQRIKFGKYTFHKPIYRTTQENNLRYEYSQLPLTVPIIEGYISHTPSKYGKKARTILFLLYDFRGSCKRSWLGIKKRVPKVSIRFSQPDDLPF